MERTKLNKTPSAILTSDWHLREDTPICRTDNYWETQWKKVDFISKLQEEYNCLVIHAGDLYDRWKITTYLSKETAKHLPNKFYTIYGQHDLPQHNIKLSERCGIDLLLEVGRLNVLPNTHWGQIPDKIKPSLHLIKEDKQTKKFIWKRKILVWHIMNYQGKLPWPGCDAPMAAKLLRKYPQYDLILTGDNHKTFHEEHEGRLLVNPGSLMRMDADQINHKPCVYLWFAEDNTVQKVFLPIEDNVISREHIERKEERDNRIDAFVSRLDGTWKADMSFEDNLEAFFKANSIRESVKEIIYHSLE